MITALHQKNLSYCTPNNNNDNRIFFFLMVAIKMTNGEIKIHICMYVELSKCFIAELFYNNNNKNNNQN